MNGGDSLAEPEMGLGWSKKRNGLVRFRLNKGIEDQFGGRESGEVGKSHGKCSN